MAASPFLDGRASAAPVLLDIGRLVWRRWSGRLPTGIDRVCLAYTRHFAGRADAALHWRGRHFVITGADAAALIDLLIKDEPPSRRRLVAALAAALPQAARRRPQPGQLYLNVGHTGLDDPGLAPWIATHRLCAVYLIHDLIPLEMPEYCRPGEAERHARRIATALASAAGIIANSQATLDALTRFADARALPAPPAIAVPLAGGALPEGVPPFRADRPYFVALGTIEGRKNHLLLLQLWRRLAEADEDAAPRLVLVGQRGWEAGDALAMLDRCPALKSVVIERGRCDDGELASVLKGARALLMPSFAEGFGLPVIEALRLGVPVIASDLPVFREIAGDIPTYRSPLDGAGWEGIVGDYASDAPERARQLAALHGWRAPDWPGHFAAVEPWLGSLTS